MGNRNSRSIESRQNSLINRILKKSKENEAQFVKLLLLGAGESGKSTIFKQMKMIFGEGISEKDRQRMAPELITNLVEGAQDIAYYGKQKGLISKGALRDVDTILALNIADNRSAELTEEVAATITRLWKDKGFRKAWDCRSHYQVQDTWADFADQVAEFPKWGGRNWVPSVEDVLRGRIRTSGVVDEVYNIKKVKFRMFDVGGQRSERRKWIHCFDNVTAVIFVAAINEYDQVLFEDNEENRLVESLKLFEETAQNEVFKDIPFILFLNKRDLFMEKFLKKKIPLNASGLFPDAPDIEINPDSNGEEEYNAAIVWFLNRFQSLYPPGKDFFHHVTCATDTQNITAVFDACAKIVLKENLSHNGFS